jgi:hypothetical protein
MWNKKSTRRQGLANFSEGFRRYSYVDLCVLEYFVGVIARVLILHYWILPDNIYVTAENFLNIHCIAIREYFISVNGDNFSGAMSLWERSKSIKWLIQLVLQIYVDAIMKEDRYRLAIMSDAFMYKGKKLPDLLSNTLLNFVSILMEWKPNSGASTVNLDSIEMPATFVAILSCYLCRPSSFDISL